MSKISVIIPVYNVEKYLRRCIDSVINQTFNDFDLILVDDGSFDNCPFICDEYAKMDRRIHVVHQKNGGLSAARNTGIDWSIKNSNSEWITFIDSDDWVHKDYLHIMFESVEKYHVDLCICGFKETKELIDDEKIYSYVGKKINTEEAYSMNHLNINVISSCAKLYRKSLWNDIRFPVGKLHEDRFTTHKIIFQTKTLAHVENCLYYYFFNVSSIVHSSWSPKRLDDFQAVKEQILYFEVNGYEKAWIRTAYNHIAAICGMINDLKLINPKYIQYRFYFHIYLLKTYFKYKKKINMKIKKQPYLSYVLEMTYPRFMKCYWFVQAFNNKLKNIIKN